MGKEEWENNEEIKIFREYLRIPTVHPDVDYSKLPILIIFSRIRLCAIIMISQRFFMTNRIINQI